MYALVVLGVFSRCVCLLSYYRFSYYIVMPFPKMFRRPTVRRSVVKSRPVVVRKPVVTRAPTVVTHVTPKPVTASTASHVASVPHGVVPSVTRAPVVTSVRRTTPSTPARARPTVRSTGGVSKRQGGLVGKAVSAVPERPSILRSIGSGVVNVLRPVGSALTDVATQSLTNLGTQAINSVVGLGTNAIQQGGQRVAGYIDSGVRGAYDAMGLDAPEEYAPMTITTDANGVPTVPEVNTYNDARFYAQTNMQSRWVAMLVLLRSVVTSLLGDVCVVQYSPVSHVCCIDVYTDRRSWEQQVVPALYDYVAQIADDDLFNDTLPNWAHFDFYAATSDNPGEEWRVAYVSFDGESIGDAPWNTFSALG